MSIQCDDDTGKCPCYGNVVGDKCEYCAPGHKHFPNCLPCDCCSDGSVDQNCDPDSGHCYCNARVEGEKCCNCMDGYYDYPNCEGTSFNYFPKCFYTKWLLCFWFLTLDCMCDYHGSISMSCDENGKCPCKEKYTGDKCDECIEGHYLVASFDGDYCEGKLYKV